MYFFMLRFYCNLSFQEEDEGKQPHMTLDDFTWPANTGLTDVNVSNRFVCDDQEALICDRI